jgi:hypothetical protein
MIRSENTFIAVPAYEAWRPKEGDQVAVFGLAGDPNDRSTSWECAWAMRRMPTFGPLLLRGFIEVASVNESERKSLQDLIGIEVNGLAKEKIDAAIQQLTTHVALKTKVPTWAQLASRLQKIVTATDTIINVFNGLSQRVISGVPSVDQTIGAHVTLALPDFPPERKIFEIIERIRVLRTAADHVLRDTENKKSERGPKMDVPFHVFCMAMIDVGHFMNIDLSLPSPRQSSKTAAAQGGRFIEFVQQVIEIASQHGITAIDQAALSQEEKTTAKIILRSYTRKTRRAIADRLRAAKTAEP